MPDAYAANGRSHGAPSARRWLPTLLTALWVICFASVFVWQSASVRSMSIFRSSTGGIGSVPRLRRYVFNLTDFGAVGDGRTVNTAAFERAVMAVRARGEGQLNVPPGTWLTAPFNLTSHMTLFLAEGAVILAVEDENLWPLLPALPSYGHGREEKGPRYGSLIHGQNLKDVVITGYNGTINGQGQIWWTKYKRRALNFTRPPLVQLMWSKDIILSNITLLDSPFWTFHPYDCKNVTVSNVTIIAPLIGAPNTDGIDPDSCEDMLIENCYISVGDDGIAIKSGWDQYGIAYGRPSTNILIRNVTIRSLISAGISIGSEMSGGVSNITVENARIWESRRAIRIKTSPGRGGFIRNLIYHNLTFDNCRVGVIVKTDYNEHADDDWDREAYPVVSNVSFVGIKGWGESNRTTQSINPNSKPIQSLFVTMSIIRRNNNVFDPFSLDMWDPFDGFPFSSSSLFSFPRSSSLSLPSDASAFATARIDWKETPTAHVFKADLPGIRKEEVKVEVEEGNVLQISGERNRESEEKTDTWHRVERSSGRFLRRFRLPENAKMDGIRAAMENGVLTVTVPKEEAKKPEVKSIEISG